MSQSAAVTTPSVMPEAIHPIDRVLARAEQMGISGKQLEREAGLGNGLISAANKAPERDRALSLPTLRAIAPVLNTTVAELIGEAAPAAGAGMVGDPDRPMVALAQLLPSLNNPRRTFDAEALAELAASIREKGILQNLVVRPLAQGAIDLPIILGDRKYPKFEIIAGERRFRALEQLARENAWDRSAFNIPVHVIRDANDQQQLVLALIENLQRQDVNPMEEAEAFAQLHKLDPKAWTGKAIAKALGCSPRYVQTRIAMVQDLSEESQTALREGRINFSQARVIAQAPTAERQQEMLEEAIVDRADQHALQRALTRGLPLAGWALFDLKAEGLQVIKTEGGDSYVVDADRFVLLQIQALRRLVPQLKKEWKWVEDHAHFDEDDFEAERSDNRKKAGAVIELGYQFSIDDLDDCSDEELAERWDGEVTIHTGLIRRATEAEPEPEGESAGARAARQKREAEEKQRKARAAACKKLQRDLAEAIEADPDKALRLLLLQLLCGDEMKLEVFTVPYASFQAGGPLEKLKPLVKANGNGGTYAGDADPAEMLRGFMARSDGQIRKALTSCVAQGFDFNAYQDAEDLEFVFLIAAELGVEVPEILRPAGQQELDQAPKMAARKKGGK
jgi:ParB family chromosome partitioning protein